MNKKSLKTIANHLGINCNEDISITGVSYDSRSVSLGDIFVCLVGEKTDGHNYISDVISKGAAAIVISENISPEVKIPILKVPNTQIALAKISNIFYDNPSSDLRLIGVTGTNGKTTTTHLIQHILELNKIKIGVIGTLGTRESTDSKYHDAKHTTPQSPELQKTLFDLKNKGFSHIAMEVSSHALALNRVYETNFSGAILTNVTQDHLDFHLTMEEYWKAKSILFSDLKKSSAKNKYAILNADDKYFDCFKNTIDKSIKLITYGINNSADFVASDIKYLPDGVSFTLKSPDGSFEVKSKLNGLFNVYNLLACIVACNAEGLPIETIIKSITHVKEVEGRFQIIKGNNNSSPICIVDYAHTPDGLENILKAAKLMVPKNKKLICVFGCGGDRDPTKRPKMGKISENLADVSIITSDNPRSEDPKQIISDILSGIENINDVIVEADRKSAIELAVQKATSGDIIVIAGKGHEDYQILKDKTIHFDDREEVKKALEAASC